MPCPFYKISQNDDCALIFLSPDVIWADGAFSRLLEISDSGKRLVAMGSFRLAKETFIPDLFEQYGRNGELQPISSRQLVKLGLRHLHPVTESQYWNEAKSSSHFGHLIWPVKDEGLIVRQFHSFPLLVRPVDKTTVPIRTLDADYGLKACPDIEDVYMVQDSDEMCFMDFTSSDQMCDFGNREDGVEEFERAVEWANRNANKLHLEFIKKKIRIHWKDISDNWGDIEMRSDEVVKAILARVENSKNADDPVILSRMRYLSIRFFRDQLRSLGPAGLVKKLISMLVFAVKRRRYGTNVRIEMLNSKAIPILDKKSILR